MGWRAWDAYESDADARRRALPWRERDSWRGILLFVFIVVVAITFVWVGAARAECEYAGQHYSIGATICECPSMKVASLQSTGEDGKITSRRLSCTKDQIWVDTNALCLDISGRGVTSYEYPKYVSMFCPRVNISPADTEKFFEAAPKDVTVTAVQVICRRFGALADTCKALIAAIQANNK